MEPELEFVDVAELVPYDRNPRVNDSAVGPLSRSIHDFGFQVPIVLDESNVIVAGHTRLKACLKLMEEGDCGLWGEAPAGAYDPDRYQDLAPRVPCIRASHLSPDELNAFRLADNKTSELSEWDFALLREERDVLQLAGFELEPYGFSDPEFTPMEFLGEFGADDAYGIERVSTTLQVTFNIPLEYADAVKAYIAENGKDGLVDAILREAGVGGVRCPTAEPRSYCATSPSGSTPTRVAVTGARTASSRRRIKRIWPTSRPPKAPRL